MFKTMVTAITTAIITTAIEPCFALRDFIKALKPPLFFGLPGFGDFSDLLSAAEAAVS